MPHGPLPAGVYWRRRLFVLGTVLALVFAVASLLAGGEEPEPPARATQASQASQDTDAGTDAEVTAPKAGQGRKKATQGDRTDRTPSEDPGQTTQPPPVEVLPEPTGTCEDSDVVLSPFVQGAVAGQPVTITLQARTLTSEACTWKFGPNHMVLKISQGADTVWASWQCQRQVPESAVVVRRDTTATIELVWNARTSTNGCGAMATWAQEGTYGVRVATFGGEPSDEVDFTLAGPEAGLPDAEQGDQGEPGEQPTRAQQGSGGR